MVRLAAIVLASACSLANADTAPKDVRVRGTVAAFGADGLKVTPLKGSPLTVALAADWKVAAVQSARIEDIKPGDYVGIASLPRNGNNDGALEVLIFPAAMKGMAEGRFGYDLKPRSMMTNATVADVVNSVSGRTVTVTYRGTRRTIDVIPGTPVVTLSPATASDVKPGVPVFVPAHRGSDGSITAGFLVIGRDGVVPPM